MSSVTHYPPNQRHFLFVSTIRKIIQKKTKTKKKEKRRSKEKRENRKKTPGSGRSKERENTL